MKVILMLHGKSRSGKDTFYNIVYKRFTKSDSLNVDDKNLGKRFDVIIKRISFADSLKAIFANLFNIDIADMHNVNKETHRENLIKFAEFCRGINPNVWVEQTSRAIFYENASPFFKIITDFRYLNEYEHVKKIIGDDVKLITIKINNDRVKGASSDFYLEHFKFDYVLDNNGTLAEFEEKVIKLINKITGGK